MGGNQFGVKRPVAYLLVRLLEVPEDCRDVPTFGGQHRLRIGSPEALALKRVKILVSEVRRLANPLRIQQTEPSLKRRSRWTRLFEQIGVGPIAHALRQSLTGFELG